jgi:hypothetical protein
MNSTAIKARIPDPAPGPKSKDRTAAGNPAPAGLHAAGNLALQRLFAGGVVRAKLEVGSPDDPREHEADRIARRVVENETPACTCVPGGAEPCPACRDRADAAIRRKARPEARNRRETAAIGLGGGRSLDAGERGFFEPRLGVDLSGVRIHTDAAAERSAASLHARAFTLGTNIAFGRGEYRPESGEGRLLLAHELAHVVQGHEGLRRQPASSPPTASAQNPESLTNADFIREMADVRQWLASHGRDDTEYEERMARRDLIEAERRRRVSLGHVWITGDLNESPGQLYQLVQRDGNVTAVVNANPQQVNGPPEDLGGNPIMTPEQFQARLALENAQTALASQLLSQLALAGGFAGPAPPTVGVPRPEGGRVSRPFSIVDPAAAPARFSDLPLPATEIPGFGIIPIDTPLPGYGPTVNNQRPRMTMGQWPQSSSLSTRFLVAFDGPNPVVVGMDQFTAGSRGQAGGMAAHGYVVSMVGSGGVGRAMLGERMLRALRMGQTAHQLQVNPSSGPRAGSSAGPQVNAVERFHAEIFRAAGRSGEPPRAGDYYQLNAEEMARVALAFGAGMLPEEAAALHRVAAGNRAALADLQALVPRAQAAARMQLQQAMFESALPGARQGSFRERAQFGFTRALLSPANPEFAAAQRFGTPQAAGRAGAMGAGFGTLLALPIDAAVTLATGGSFDHYGDRVPRVLATGGVAGGLAGASEQWLVSRASSSIITGGLGPGLGTTASMLGARIIPGGIGAVGAELLNVYVFEADRPHSGREVGLRAARAGGIGMVSTAAGLGAQAATTSVIGAILASGGSGATGGSVVPGWGTAIGFVVGLGVGVTVYVILDRNLPTVDPTQ